ncbi:MAG: type IV pilus twitching motility protein PilT [Chitinispirillaceae bacterium]|nr:type IV pilus twitching motility protein PilT [Chitinispirillaceae bacterium]
MNIDAYLKSLIVDGVSDLHFKTGRPPLRRIFGVVKPAESPVVDGKTAEELARHFLGPQLWERFLQNLEMDIAYAIPGFARFRVNIYRQRGLISIAMRFIPFRIPTMEELGVPPMVKEIAMSNRGLVLVTGMSGSGKSSTLAAMIDHINGNWPCHIITIEDPIEFLHEDRVAVINQREVGIDTMDFHHALRSALRQDPDVILVGELRDGESMEIALRAAETGHLVMGTLHTTDAKETIGRFIDTFPSHQQRQVRIQLAFNLRAVISQRLLERVDQKGLALAAEVMIVNAAIRGYILESDKLGEILENIQKGKEQYGMQSFDQSIIDLYRKGLISLDEALKNATSPTDMKLKLRLHESSTLTLHKEEEQRGKSPYPY